MPTNGRNQCCSSFLSLKHFVMWKVVGKGMFVHFRNLNLSNFCSTTNGINAACAQGFDKECKKNCSCAAVATSLTNLNPPRISDEKIVPLIRSWFIPHQAQRSFVSLFASKQWKMCCRGTLCLIEQAKNPRITLASRKSWIDCLVPDEKEKRTV